MDRLALTARSVLRGIAQVFLQPNEWTGLLMLAGLAAWSWRMALLVLLGTVVQTLAGWVSGRGEQAKDGLMGYNGALVGAAAHLDLADALPAVLATVVGAMACVPLHAALERLFSSRGVARLGLPVLTAPFCMVAGALLVTVRGLNATSSALTADASMWRGGGLGFLNDVAEVYLADGVIAGILILLGLFVASWRVGLWACLGSAVAVACGWLVHADATTLSEGLLGYSAVLVAIALGTTFLPKASLGVRLALTVVGCVATIGLRALMTQGPVPVYTWPFVIVTWIAIAAYAVSSHRTATDGVPA